MKKRCQAAAILLSILLLAGCASRYPRLDIVEPLPANSSCRLVLLPFVNKSEYPQGAAILYKAFAAELNSLPGYELVPEGDVLQLYRQLRVYRTMMPNEKQMQVIGERLDAQLIIAGDILKMTESDSGDYVDTHMTLFIQLLDGASGKLLWEIYHRRSGEEYRNIMHYGRVNSITGLARRMVKEIKELWMVEGIGKCEK